MSNSDKNNQANFEAELFGMTLSRADGAGAGPTGSAHAPLHIQVTEALRSLILRGLYNGLRLPPSRGLAQELSVSRMTVTTAYDQLIAEGYLTARRGDGTYVAQDVPHLATPVVHRASRVPHRAGYVPFQPGLPDQTLFPHRIWARHLDRAWRNPDPALLDRPDPFGWYPLRQSIADHLAIWRGLECAADQVVITAGARDVFDILCHAVLPRPDGTPPVVAIEDPGWPVMYDLLGQAGAAPVPLPIDADGFDPALIPDATRAVIVSPSRQYPTGVVMPVTRRLALIEWARARGAVIVEDDYDSEFRYQGQPLPSLAGLDQLRSTIYAGSFSKLLSPGLRIGYAVLPVACVGVVRDYLTRSGPRASILPQPALAAFMASGAFSTHLRRMRRIYAGRQKVLRDALVPVNDLLTLGPDPAGMHLIAPLTPRLRAKTTDRVIAARATAAGMTLRTVSEHARFATPAPALLLGYTAFEDDVLRHGARHLCDLLAGL